MKAILLFHTAATLMMVGVIWFIQIVHYPLFERVGENHFRQYETSHMALTSAIVIPVMLFEIITAAFLALEIPTTRFGFVLLTIIWLSTLFVQSPLHSQLASGFNIDVHHQLVMTNWIRTILWSVRGVAVLWILSQYVKVP